MLWEVKTIQTIERVTVVEADSIEEALNKEGEDIYYDSKTIVEYITEA